MDYHAFDKLSYGLYIVSSEAGGKAAGCTVAFFTTLKPYVWKSAHPSIQSSRMEAIRFANALV
mgnify:CR=1 FL=1